ncbi:uncharacterized protein LOC142504951 [Primulina tabacum]|uniref:uncharacterized protein LOC142504951 n=1 Tax=Primulina tabacum TaxID=48773 RepID=UPI003F5AC284
MKFDEVYDHLIINGFDPSYMIWVFHGETYTPQFQGQSSSGGVHEKEAESREAYNLYKDVFFSDEGVAHTMSEAKDYEFANLLVDAETPLFPGCTTYMKLSAVVTLYNYKCTNGHTDNSFNELLKILHDMLPGKNTLPENVYSMRKILKPFDLGYEKIHACPNDCCLFRKEFKDLDSCPKCGSSRWKVDKVNKKVCKGIPEMVLRYSCWPVILVNYNLPPLMCIAKENLMLKLLIPRPKQPGNDIDVYFEPLVEDLKELWDTGVETYDAFSKSMFNMKAILMWTINDFPAYGNLAGCATKEKKWFDGNKETKGKPKPLNGLEILNAVNDIENDWGKKKIGMDINNTKKKRKKRDGSKKVQEPVQMWKKKSIFFNLPYWRGLLLRHNLDVMHVEKNVCENIIGTMLNLKKKSKHGVNARKDLWLKKIKLPDGYSSNIGNCVSLE